MLENINEIFAMKQVSTINKTTSSDPFVREVSEIATYFIATRIRFWEKALKDFVVKSKEYEVVRTEERTGKYTTVTLHIERQEDDGRYRAVNLRVVFDRRYNWDATFDDYFIEYSVSKAVSIPRYTVVKFPDLLPEFPF